MDLSLTSADGSEKNNVSGFMCFKTSSVKDGRNLVSLIEVKYIEMFTTSQLL